MTRILLLGHGRMGQLVEQLATQHQCKIAAIITRHDKLPEFVEALGPFDVAIDFSTPEALPTNLPALAERGINVVVGTTGWQDREAEMRAMVEESGIGVLAASNFSIGLHIFRKAVAEAARGFAARDSVGAWVHEAHHAMKKDAPSGTALTLKKTMVDAGYQKAIDVSSTRAGSIPGTHTVGFDSPSETVTLTHAVRDRSVFARGALDVARWLVDKRGWLTMDDYLNSVRRDS
jgi:4-hydroxy-tetrahydrodipicolinate reductase